VPFISCYFSELLSFIENLSSSEGARARPSANHPMIQLIKLVFFTLSLQDTQLNPTVKGDFFSNNKQQQLERYKQTKPKKKNT